MANQFNLRTQHMTIIEEGGARAGSDKTKWGNAAIELKDMIARLSKQATQEKVVEVRTSRLVERLFNALDRQADLTGPYGQ